MQERPICFKCERRVDHGQEPVFAAVCDHQRCPSVVFHGMCLMEWREYRDAYLASREGIEIVAIFERRPR